MLSKSSGSGLFGGRSGTVTVVDSRFYRSSARNARVAFIVASLVVGLLAGIVAADRMHPIVALFYGALVGVGAGALVWAVVRIWPVLRLIWWWLFEITAAVFVVSGWVFLADHTDTALMLVTVGLLVGVPAGVGPVRRRLVALAWCVIVRHRLRTCFAQFMGPNRNGALPLIGFARPTPVGERVSITLRPGLSVTDLEHNLELLAVGCKASIVTVERASATNASKVRVDVRRREVLNTTVDSPLVDYAHPVDPTAPGADSPLRSVMDLAPTALDLPDVTAPKPRPAKSNGANGRVANGRVHDTAVVSGPDDEINQWI